MSVDLEKKQNVNIFQISHLTYMNIQDLPIKLETLLFQIYLKTLEKVWETSLVTSCSDEVWLKDTKQHFDSPNIEHFQGK